MRPAIFVICSLGLAYISRLSLLRPHSHGFYRFFAWEAVVALVLLNAPNWFRDPFAWFQIASWILFALSIIPVVLGVHGLRTRGSPDQNKRPDPTLIAFEPTSRLVSDGIFRYIRHPLYCSLLLLAWGLFFKRPSLLGGILAVAATSLLIVTSKVDEAECIRTFGADYRTYMQHTRMFIPYVF